MSTQPRMYIAGIGMVTPLGLNTAMTSAAVRTGVSAYAETEYTGQQGLLVTMAAVPAAVFDEVEADIEEGGCYDTCHDRILKMAIIAIREACSHQSTKQPVPLLLTKPEVSTDTGKIDSEGLVPLLPTLEQNCKPWISAQQCRMFYSGRAAGMEAIGFAFRYLYDQPNDFVLIGGSDSYRDYARLKPLSDANRLKVASCLDGFAPGEAGGFLLLTRRPELALVKNGHVIALNVPGITEEPGHFHSKEPYRGDGLDQAFKMALGNDPAPNAIHSIYSSMNGEFHWAKEYGVAYMRNRNAFKDPVGTEHPADCYGDLGAATSPILIALAAEHLFRDAKAWSHLVYSSSDRGKRGAIVIEKVPIQKWVTSVQAPQQQRIA